MANRRSVADLVDSQTFGGAVYGSRMSRVGEAINLSDLSGEQVSEWLQSFDTVLCDGDGELGAAPKVWGRAR